jgi:hypothetical protein
VPNGPKNVNAANRSEATTKRITNNNKITKTINDRYKCYHRERKIISLYFMTLVINDK